MKRVLVTGAAGFIGGQTLLNLSEQGYEVMGVDRQVPSKELLTATPAWLTGDFANEIGLESIKSYNPDAIIHCAGTSLVGPSVNDPREYYENNYVKTKRMVDFLIDNKLTAKVIFSSSAATYGEPIMVPCQESDPASPISPYGESKLMVEWLLTSYAKAYGINAVMFRYFNACGADHQARHGQASNGTHIIARVLESIKAGKDFTLYGTSYPTDDGTCIRDYIHVEDIASAHIRALEDDVPTGVYNIGTNKGVSNLNIVKAAARITGKDVGILRGAERAGDPAMLTADAGKFTNLTGWQPKYDLDDMIRHAWAWYNV